MNFNYSYRAFLITSLLFGIFFLALYSIKLSSEEEVVYENYDVAYEDLESLLEEEPERMESTDISKIETNKAYNEAEKLLEELGNEETQSIEEKLAQLDAAMQNAEASTTAEGIEKAKQKLQEANEVIAKNKSKSTHTVQGASRKTTISYRLVDRKAMALPNPVYTCEAGGKIVLSIEVNELGKITNMTFNKGLSNTTNGCLIDSAMEYAQQSRFTTKAGKTSQLGTITYNFPGQN